MFWTLTWRRGGILRLLVFMLVVGALLFYISSRRPQELVQETDSGGIRILPVGPSLQNPAPAQLEEFFIDFRLERDGTRQQQLDLLRELINNPNSDEASRKEANRRFLRIVDTIGKEVELEGLIRAKGFDDALVFLQEESATVVVKAAVLAAPEVARIADIVMRGTGLKLEAISILSLPR